VEAAEEEADNTAFPLGPLLSGTLKYILLSSATFIPIYWPTQHSIELALGAFPSRVKMAGS